jgi:hypothetical protein
MYLVQLFLLVFFLFDLLSYSFPLFYFYLLLLIGFIARYLDFYLFFITERHIHIHRVLFFVHIVSLYFDLLI